jgi:hypothetical protein
MANIFLQGAQPVIGFETLTVSSTGKVLTPTSYETFESVNQTRRQAKLALITVEDNSIRFRLDGTAPTTALGHLVVSGSALELQSITQIRNLKMIAAAADATIQVTYFGS